MHCVHCFFVNVIMCCSLCTLFLCNFYHVLFIMSRELGEEGTASPAGGLLTVPPEESVRATSAD